MNLRYEVEQPTVTGYAQGKYQSDTQNVLWRSRPRRCTRGNGLRRGMRRKSDA